MTEYKLRKKASTCAISDEPFVDGDEIVSAIYADEAEGFYRRDMLARHYTDAEAAFSYWKTRHVVEPSDAHRLDYGLALDFLKKLLAEADPAREPLAFTLALLLVRKRRIKLKGTASLPEGELLTVTVRGDEEDEELQIRAPRLQPDQIDAVQAELATLFGFSSGGEAAQNGDPEESASADTAEPA